MWRIPLTLALFVTASDLAQAQHLYFTTMIPPGCPIVIEGTSHTKEFGFQAIVLRNESPRTIQSLQLNVTLAAPGGPPKLIDRSHIYISIEPGDRKSEDVFLARMQSLRQRIQYDHLEIARAMIIVESVEFADGSSWSADVPVPLEPTDPIPFLRPLPPQ